LDIGDKRVGVAVANGLIRVARPLTTLENNEQTLVRLRQIILEEHAVAIVVGLPRGLQSQETEQTKTVRSYVVEMQKTLDLPIFWQDEALTSHKAEEELRTRGKVFQKGDIDALAATYILDDFLTEGIKHDV
jgi:putative Holliday junction resolvase